MCWRWLGDIVMSEIYANFCKFRQLSSIGVTSVPSQAGYYFMPDFTPLYHKFKNGTEMCEAMLKEANVAVG